jgi:hypothetical protein
MNPLWKIRALAIALIVLFGLGALLAVRAIFTAGMSPLLLFSVATNLGFVAGGIGLLTFKPWSWWLTIGLCVIGIVQLLWQIFTTLTPETATKQSEIASYVIAGFYLAITFLLTSDSIRKVFRERHAQNG